MDIIPPAPPPDLFQSNVRSEATNTVPGEVMRPPRIIRKVLAGAAALVCLAAAGSCVYRALDTPRTTGEFDAQGYDLSGCVPMAPGDGERSPVFSEELSGRAELHKNKIPTPYIGRDNFDDVSLDTDDTLRQVRLSSMLPKFSFVIDTQTEGSRLCAWTDRQDTQGHPPAGGHKALVSVTGRWHPGCASASHAAYDQG